MTGKPRLSDGQFLDRLDELTVKAVGMYRQARAAKPDLSEREFMQAFRAAVSLGLGAGLAETAVAMMRYAAKLEDERGGELPSLPFLLEGEYELDRIGVGTGEDPTYPTLSREYPIRVVVGPAYTHLNAAAAEQFGLALIAAAREIRVREEGS